MRYHSHSAVFVCLYYDLYYEVVNSFHVECDGIICYVNGFTRVSETRNYTADADIDQR